MALMATGCAGAAEGPEPTSAEATSTETPQPTITASVTRTPTATSTSTSTSTSTPTATLPPNSQLIQPMEPGQEVVIRSIHMQTTSEGWAIGIALEEPFAPDHVLWTDDGGLTWRDVTPTRLYSLLDPSTGEVGAAYFSGLVAWIYYNGADGVQHSAEQGAAWNLGAAGHPIATESWLTFSDSDHGWLMQSVEAAMGSELVALFRTTDTGSHWTEILDPHESEYLQSCFKTGIDFEGANTGWITLDCQGVYVEPFLEWSTDGGESWEQHVLPLPEGAPRSPESGFCTAGSPRLLTDQSGWLKVTCVTLQDDELVESSYAYFTADSGENWLIREFPGGEPIFMNERQLLALGMDQHQSIDGGQRWTRMNTVSWQGQYSFVDLTNGWAVATSGDETALVITKGGGRVWEIIEPVIARE